LLCIADPNDPDEIETLPAIFDSFAPATGRYPGSSSHRQAIDVEFGSHAETSCRAGASSWKNLPLVFPTLIQPAAAIYFPAGKM
jgi:hypothetical protein